MDSIAEFKGQNGKIIVYEDSLTISKNTFGGRLSQAGSSGDRNLHFKDIVTVEYKKPNFFSNGYFKVIVNGTKETNAKVGVLGSSMASMKDQNTIVLRAFSKKVSNETDRIYKLIAERLSISKKDNNTSLNQPDRLDELKKIGELKASGILTEEEFQQEKNKILKR